MIPFFPSRHRCQKRPFWRMGGGKAFFILTSRVLVFIFCSHIYLISFTSEVLMFVTSRFSLQYVNHLVFKDLAHTHTHTQPYRTNLRSPCSFFATFNLWCINVIIILLSSPSLLWPLCVWFGPKKYFLSFYLCGFLFMWDTLYNPPYTWPLRGPRPGRWRGHIRGGGGARDFPLTLRQIISHLRKILKFWNITNCILFHSRDQTVVNIRLH